MSGRKPHSQKVDQKYSCIFEKGVDKEGNKYSIPYCLLKELGRGGFAKCYSTRLLGKDDKFAVKIFEKHNDRSHNIAKVTCLLDRSKIRLRFCLLWITKE